MGIGEQVIRSGIEVLSVAGVGKPNRGTGGGKPEGLAREKLLPAFGRGIGELELVAPPGVVAGGDGNRLAVAAFQQFKLAVIEGFTYGVVDEVLGVGLLGGGDDFSEGDRQAG